MTLPSDGRPAAARLPKFHELTPEDRVILCNG